MNPGRRAMDESSHAHKRESDPDDFARLHHRACDDPDRRFEWHIPTQEEKPMNRGMEDVPRTECAEACAFGAFVGALAGCVIGALVVLGGLLLWV